MEAVKAAGVGLSGEVGGSEESRGEENFGVLPEKGAGEFGGVANGRAGSVRDWKQ